MTEELQKFAGKWKMDRGENIEEFFKAMGMNFVLRKMASSARPVHIVTVEGNTLKVVMQTAFMTREDEIKLGEEYVKEDEKMGFKAKCKARIEDGKLIVNQEPLEGANNKGSQVITREIINEETVVTIEMEDLVSKRWFKKLE